MDNTESSGSGKFGRSMINTQPERRLTWEAPKLVSLAMPNASGSCGTGSNAKAGNNTGGHSYCKHGAQTMSCVQGSNAGPGCLSTGSKADSGCANGQGNK